VVVEQAAFNLPVETTFQRCGDQTAVGAGGLIAARGDNLALGIGAAHLPVGVYLKTAPAAPLALPAGAIRRVSRILFPSRFCAELIGL
jgi:hypothetical protein